MCAHVCSCAVFDGDVGLRYRLHAAACVHDVNHSAYPNGIVCPEVCFVVSEVLKARELTDPSQFVLNRIEST